jgi:CBS domain-containing protein
MGFIHYNCTIAEQAAAVAKVKAHCPGFVVTPVCMKPSDTVSALDNLKVGPSHKQAAVAARGWGHTQAAAAAQGRHGGGGGGSGWGGCWSVVRCWLQAVAGMRSLMCSGRRVCWWARERDGVQGGGALGTRAGSAFVDSQLRPPVQDAAANADSLRTAGRHVDDIDCTYLHVCSCFCCAFLQLTKNFTSVCVTDTGAVGGQLLGIVTTRDVDFVNDRATPLEEIMTRWVGAARRGQGPGGGWGSAGCSRCISK